MVINRALRFQLKKLSKSIKHSVNSLYLGIAWLGQNWKNPKVLIVAILAVLIVGGSFTYWLHSNSDTNYAKGVLAINTDKSSYVSGDTVLFLIASLDSTGNTQCTSNLKLEITIPKQRKNAVLTTKENQLVPTATCSPENDATNDADYISRFITSTPGTYKLLLTNLDSGKKLKTSFDVKSKTPDFQISRYGATRLNPSKLDRHPMIITIQANKDMQGKLIETVPADYQFKWIGPATVAQVDNGQTLTWSFDLKAGESKEFSYEFSVPRMSPRFIRLKGANIYLDQAKTSYTENKEWHTAITKE